MPKSPLRICHLKWSHLILGAAGEHRSIRYLKRNGYTILARNWRTPKGEIDILALRDRIIVFVEVKTRSIGVAARFPPSEAITKLKERKLKALAESFVLSRAAQNKSARILSYRFDCITLLLVRRFLFPVWKIRHNEDIFSTRS